MQHNGAAPAAHQQQHKPRDHQQQHQAQRLGDQPEQFGEHKEHIGLPLAQARAKPAFSLAISLASAFLPIGQDCQPQ